MTQMHARSNQAKNVDPSDAMKAYMEIPIHPELERMVDQITNDLGHSDDLVIRYVPMDNIEDRSVAAIIYIDGISDSVAINRYLIELMNHLVARDTFLDAHDEKSGTAPCSELIRNMLFSMGPIKTVKSLGFLFQNLLNGEAIVLIHGSDVAYCADVRQFKDRNISESANQTAIRGPRESFNETLRTNTALIRRKIKDPRLRLETLTVGEITKTNITLMYIQEMVKPQVLEEARKRIEAIRIDSILESGYIEELIEDAKYSLFPTIYNTELPDNVAGQLLEGRIAILVDGTPNVLVVPTQFTAFLQSAEDYYQRAVYASLLRVLRFASLFISLLLPSLYIAVSTFHRDMLPTSLLISLAAQREGVPFPAFVEAFAMEVMFEILREAGLRMPRPIGQAVSVVGTLVIGQAAVEAGIVSAAMVIIVSVTAISTFTLPAYSMSIPIRILRFIFMAAAATFGLFGIVMCLFIMLLHLCSLRSFGEPYMAPFGPYQQSDLGDVIVRLPKWLKFRWPSYSKQQGKDRLNNR